MANRFTVEAIFKAIDRVSAPVRKMTGSFSKFTRTVTVSINKVNRVMKRFGEGLKRTLTRGTVALGLFGAAVGNIIGVTADFGRSISIAAAKFKTPIERGTQAFKDLGAAAKKVGAETEFTASQAARGLVLFAQSGFNAEDAMKSLAPLVDFATASTLELDEASKIATKTLGAFGLTSDDSAEQLTNLNRVFDVLSFTANNATSDVATIFEAIKDGGAAVKSVGGDIETFGAFVGTLANASIDATRAGTALKNIMLATVGVGNQATKVFQELRIPLEDKETGKIRDTLDVLDDLKKALKTKTPVRQIAIADAIFGKIPFAAVTKLLDTGIEKVRKMREEIRELSGGSSRRTAEFIRKDLKGSIDAFTSAIENVKISIGELNEGPLKKAIDRMTDWIRVNEEVIATKIGNFLVGIIENFEEIGEKVLFFGKAIAIFVAFSSVVKTLAALMTLLNFAIAANPFVRAALAIAAAVAGLATLAAFVSGAEETEKGLTRREPIRFGALGVVGGDADVSDSMEPRKFFNSLKTVFDPDLNAIKNLRGALFPLFQKNENEATDSLTENNARSRPNIVSPQERTARSVQESIQTNNNNAEVTIRTEKGSEAEVTGGRLSSNIELISTGSFA